MTIHLKTAALVGAICIAASGVQADPKPKGAKNADPQTIANFHAGKTHNWKSCKGGIYYGGGWEAQAYCNREGPAIGIGTWRVNAKGRICHDLTWYWQSGDGSVGSKKDPVTDNECTDHVVSPDGTIWRSWGGEADWWRLKTSKSMVKGFKHKAKVNRLRRKLGV